MVYGEDQYDIPVAVNPASFTNIFIDQPLWEASGAESNRFYCDIRHLDEPNVPKTWNLTGQLLGNVLSDSIHLEWNMENLDILSDHEITLIAGEELVDMRENNSKVIVKEYFENLQITVGPIVNSDSCEALGLVTCEDGSCAATLEDCMNLSNDLIPDDFMISNPYPNPFNPSVTFDFSLPSINHVEINIYDINGIHIDTILDETKSAGHHNIIWNAENYPTGMYFIRFLSKDGNKTMKVMLIK